MDKPLTSFTPPINKAIIGERGTASPELPFAFFAWLAHVPLKLAERILSSLSADKRSPKGLGLEGIRGASYALDVPAKQKRVLSAPPAFLILIITCRRQ